MGFLPASPAEAPAGLKSNASRGPGQFQTLFKPSLSDRSPATRRAARAAGQLTDFK